MTAKSSQQEHDEQQDTREMARVMTAALVDGKSEKEIVEDLIRTGWSEETAKDFVRRALRVGKFQW
jgi:ParB-like chromosome segregation protein Spo0J